MTEKPAPPTEPASGHAPGWYPYFNGVRFFDGQEWTDQIAYSPPKPVVGPWEIAAAAFAGVLLALFVVWLGAQLAPDHIYLPVKFVVDDLPEALR